MEGSLGPWRALERESGAEQWPGGGAEGSRLGAAAGLRKGKPCGCGSVGARLRREGSRAGLGAILWDPQISAVLLRGQEWGLEECGGCRRKGTPGAGGPVRRESEEPPLREPRHWGSERRDPGSCTQTWGFSGKRRRRNEEEEESTAGQGRAQAVCREEPSPVGGLCVLGRPGRARGAERSPQAPQALLGKLPLTAAQGVPLGAECSS